MLLKRSHSIKPGESLSENREMALFSAQSLRFLRDLKRHNDRDWFQPRKSIFEEHVKEPMHALIQKVNHELAGSAPGFVTDPKKAMLRIYRDTRFSQDKTPYKTHASALFWRKQAGKLGGAVLYLSISPAECVIAGGSYMPTPPELLALRQHLAENHARLGAILKVKALRDSFGELRGEQLQRAPKGFDPNHRAIELLKQKQWYLRASLAPQAVTEEQFVPDVLKKVRLLIPLVNFLNEPLLAKAARPKDPLTVEYS
jgi:uncharacterized protein (TIGR02453 family)